MAITVGSNPTLPAAGGGGGGGSEHTLISQVVAAGGETEFVFTDLDGWDEIKIVGSNLRSSGANTWLLHNSVDNGATYLSTSVTQYKITIDTAVARTAFGVSTPTITGSSNVRHTGFECVLRGFGDPAVTYQLTSRSDESTNSLIHYIWSNTNAAALNAIKITLNGTASAGSILEIWGKAAP